MAENLWGQFTDQELEAGVGENIARQATPPEHESLSCEIMIKRHWLTNRWRVFYRQDASGKWRMLGKFQSKVIAIGFAVHFVNVIRSPNSSIEVMTVK